MIQLYLVKYWLPILLIWPQYWCYSNIDQLEVKKEKEIENDAQEITGSIYRKKKETKGSSTLGIAGMQLFKDSRNTLKRTKKD